MFYGKYFVDKEIIRTKFGSICIENIRFNPDDLQEALPQIVFEEENLKFMFSETELDSFKSTNIFKRFIPKSAPSELTIDYISNSISSNHNFYSF